MKKSLWGLQEVFPGVDPNAGTFSKEPETVYKLDKANLLSVLGRVGATGHRARYGRRWRHELPFPLFALVNPVPLLVCMPGARSIRVTDLLFVPVSKEGHGDDFGRDQRLVSLKKRWIAFKPEKKKEVLLRLTVLESQKSVYQLIYKQGKNSYRINLKAYNWKS